MTNQFQIINGIKCYAPKLAYQNTHFSETVFQFLYSAEEKNFWFCFFEPPHQYEKRKLEAKLKDASFKVKYISSFFSILFPLMYLSRLLQRNNSINKENEEAELKELQLNKYVNSMFLQIMKIDEYLIKQNIALPFGGSLIAVAQKI